MTQLTEEVECESSKKYPKCVVLDMDGTLIDIFEAFDNDEEDSLHSGSENESEEEFSSAGEDSDINGAVGKSDDDDIEEDEDMGNNTIQQFSSTSLKEDIEKGTAAKHQLSKLKNC